MIGQIVSKRYEIIVVNDGSQDQTKKVLKKLEKKYSCLKVIHHDRNLGYGAALRTGFAAAKTDWLFYTDGDGQYDPNQIVILLQELKLHPNLEVINGYVEQRQDNWQRLFFGSIYNKF